MENPYEEAQTVLLNRIIGQVVRHLRPTSHPTPLTTCLLEWTENPHHPPTTGSARRRRQDKLNEAFLEAIRSLSEVNEHNKQISEITDMWANYNRNVRWNLSSQGELGEPK